MQQQPLLLVDVNLLSATLKTEKYDKNSMSTGSSLTGVNTFPRGCKPLPVGNSCAVLKIEGSQPIF
jgi:hypothetical protein